jgi:molybdopterin-guanine dinucleotide biosynthesis protein
LELARRGGAREIFAVGTAKGVGKTTALRAVYEAACSSGLRVGVASVGHKAGLPLRPQTTFVTARSLLPRSPAVEILQTSRVASAAGELLYARAACDGEYAAIGPSSASALREVIAQLAARCDVVLVDGAIDRIATVAASGGAILVSCGAAGAKSMAEAVAGVAALVARLRVPLADADEDAVELEGALTATVAAALVAAGERRQIVVRDPTRIVMSGASLAQALARLRVRCRTPLRVVAATTCALAPERGFEPAAFLRDVASATALPAFDVFAGMRAA